MLRLAIRYISHQTARELVEANFLKVGMIWFVVEAAYRSKYNKFWSLWSHTFDFHRSDMNLYHSGVAECTSSKDAHRPNSDHLCDQQHVGTVGKSPDLVYHRKQVVVRKALWCVGVSVGGCVSVRKGRQKRNKQWESRIAPSLFFLRLRSSKKMCDLLASQWAKFNSGHGVLTSCIQPIPQLHPLEQLNQSSS